MAGVVDGLDRFLLRFRIDRNRRTRIGYLFLQGTYTLNRSPMLGGSRRTSGAYARNGGCRRQLTDLQLDSYCSILRPPLAACQKRAIAVEPRFGAPRQNVQLAGHRKMAE
jgi:hypothetical protein